MFNSDSSLDWIPFGLLCGSVCSVVVYFVQYETKHTIQDLELLFNLHCRFNSNSICDGDRSST